MNSASLQRPLRVDSVVSSSTASGAWPNRPAALSRGPIVKPMSSQLELMVLGQPGHLLERQQCRAWDSAANN